MAKSTQTATLLNATSQKGYDALQQAMTMPLAVATKTFVAESLTSTPPPLTIFKYSASSQGRNDICVPNSVNKCAASREEVARLLISTSYIFFLSADFTAGLMATSSCRNHKVGVCLCGVKRNLNFYTYQLY